MVEVLSSTPARLFGLPSKGAIAVGRDADLVLLDPDAQRTITQADLSHTSDYTPYEGMPVTGAIRAVLVRGRPPDCDWSRCGNADAAGLHKGIG